MAPVSSRARQESPTASRDSQECRDIEEAIHKIDSAGEELDYVDADEGLTPGSHPSAFAESDCGGGVDRREDIPALEESGIAIPATELFASGHQVGNQCCVHSLGRFKKPAPYWIATGLRRAPSHLYGRRVGKVPAARIQASSARPPPVDFSGDGDSECDGALDSSHV
jgi:hypothetical protein